MQREDAPDPKHAQRAVEVGGGAEAVSEEGLGKAGVKAELDVGRATAAGEIESFAIGGEYAAYAFE